MPRQQTYGKRSRALYDLRAIAFSSPEPFHPKPVKRQGAETVRAKPDPDKKYLHKVVIEQRTALIDKDANSIVKHEEAVDAGQKQSQKIRIKRKVDKSKKKPTEPVYERAGNDFFVPSEDVAPQKDSDHGKGNVAQTPNPTSNRQDGATPGQILREAAPTYPPENGDQIPQPERNEPLRDVCVQEQMSSLTSTEIKSDTRVPTENQTFQEHCKAILDLSSHSLTQFQAWSDQISQHFQVTKIAEASYGEVYRLAFLEDMSEYSTADESVFKVIAIQAPKSTLPLDKRKRRAALKQAEAMSDPAHVANEVKLLQRMSSIPGFTNFRDVRVLQGRPPAPFVEAFKAFNVNQKMRGKDLSHFSDPSKKSSYSTNQLWAVIEMQDAGTDLERLVEMGCCTSIWTTWDIFWQVVFSLAKGEEGAAFEHRDLHLGNVCVRHTPELRSSAEEEIDIKRKLGFTTVETTIIDYTLSRCVMPDKSIAFHDLALDNAIFEGDSTEEYQYDIYRYMRSALFLDDASADFDANVDKADESQRSWRQYHPQTNLVWLHFVLYMLLEQLQWPSAKKIPSRKKEAHKSLRAKWKRANELEHALLSVQEMLDPTQICENGLRSAGDLVSVALGEGWVDVEDIIGSASSDNELVQDFQGLGFD